MQPSSKRPATSSVVQLEKKLLFADDTDLKSKTPNDDVANKRASLALKQDTPHPTKKKRDLKSIRKGNKDQDGSDKTK